MRTSILVAATLLASSSVLVAGQAHALGPLDLELGAKVGAGSNPLGSGAPNPMGFGLGGRAGVSILGLYAGVNVMYYLGGKEDVPLVGTVTNHSLLYGGEVGYGIKLLGLLTIRPQIGVGSDTISTNVSAAAPVPGGSKGYLYLEPGVTALISIGILYLGADVNALLLPAGPSNTSSSSKFDAGLTAHGQIGVTF